MTPNPRRPVYVAGPYAAYTITVNGREVHVSEAENVRRAILVARAVSATGAPVMLPHVTGQAVYGEDTPEVRARVLPDCLSVVGAVARAGGQIVAIARGDGSLSTGTRLEWRHFQTVSGRFPLHQARTWSEWRHILRQRGIDPDEAVETVWSLRERLSVP